MKKERLIQFISSVGGTVRLSTVLNHGFNRYSFYSLVYSGQITQISRGIYRLTSFPTTANPDMTVVALRIPKAVFCLVSALAFHKLTTQIPHTMEIALPQKTKTPKLDYPTLTVHRFSPASYTAGIETSKIDAIDVQVYSREKTLADCFKFRNKIGLDIFLEALTCYKKQKLLDYQQILYFSKINRVEKTIMPYLEASQP